MTWVSEFAARYRLFLCLECGKCVAACPMGKIFDDFSLQVSPRGVIKRVLLGQEVAEHIGLWYCLECNLCASICPTGVRFRDFVAAARQAIVVAGNTRYCSTCRHCGVLLWPHRTGDYLRQALGETGEGLVLCPRCRQYDLGRKVKAFTPGIGQGRVQIGERR